jgi:hypothetical protein
VKGNRPELISRSSWGINLAAFWDSRENWVRIRSMCFAPSTHSFSFSGMVRATSGGDSLLLAWSSIVLPFVQVGSSTLRLLVVRSRRLQVADHQARYFVDKLPCFLAGEDIWATQDCRMCQRFHYCH